MAGIHQRPTMKDGVVDGSTACKRSHLAQEHLQNYVKASFALRRPRTCARALACREGHLVLDEVWSAVRSSAFL